MANDARKIVQEVLPRRMADEVWSGRYDKALPISSNEFELSAVLPAVFYMFRFGERRGHGKFLEAFADKDGTLRHRRRTATVNRIAKRLSEEHHMEGFDDQVQQAVLGDLLLCVGLENRGHALGREQQVQRVAPTHYMASWIDLPENVAHLRNVPEMIVAMLANQEGEHIQPNSSTDPTWFPVAIGHDKNLLLRAFSQGVERRGEVSSRTADRFDEQDSDIGLDQLLMVRLAQQLGEAPDKLRGRGSPQISNQRPIAKRAAEYFSEDIRRFVRTYAEVIPRYAFVDMLESCIATGMTVILTSTIEILFRWADTGEIPNQSEQQPVGLFVDSSNGVNVRLRDVAEQSFDDLMRRIEGLPIILMMLRLLDYAARNNRMIKQLAIPTRPYATEWLNILGAMLQKRHEVADFIHQTMDDYCEKLADALEKEDPDATSMLRGHNSQPNPVRRLAAALTELLGRGARSHLIGMVDSTLHIGRPNGLAQKRATTRGARVIAARRRRDVRSLILTDSVLDYLVHLHVLKTGNTRGTRRLSLKEFLVRLRQRYGFHVDTVPPGMMVSNELLQLNRAVLERRLRDLGLLAGVNDAEAMKRLQPRFELLVED